MRGDEACLTILQGLDLLGSTLYCVPVADGSLQPSITLPDIARIAAAFGGIVGSVVMPADIQDLKVWIDQKCWCLPAIQEFWLELPTYAKFNSPKMVCWWRREILTHAYNQIREVMIMAGKQSKTAPAADEVTWVFIQVDLTDEEIEAAIGQFSDGGVLWDMAVETMQEGYKLSITYDDRSDSFCASLTGKNCPKGNIGKTITGWYDDPTSALAVVLYKHAVKLEGIWENPDKDKKRRG